MSLRTSVRKHGFASSLAVIALAGFLLRVVNAVAVRDQAVGGDGFRFHFGALLLADGEGFLNPLGYIMRNVRTPDTGHPPAWTIVLAGSTKLGLRTWLEHQIVASIIGTVTIVMTGLAGRAAFGRRVGVLAAALVAFYPFVWLYEREVVSKPLAMLGVATMIWLAYTFVADPGPGLALALGAVLGVLAMTKSDQIALAVVLVAPLILSRREVGLRRRVGWLAVAGVTCLVIVLPWSIYLSARFDRPVVLTGSVGGAMAAGNCAETYRGSLLGYYDFRCVLRVNGSGDPITRDEQARRHAFDFMRRNERRVPIVMAARVARTFGFYRPVQQMHLETERGTSVRVFRAGFLAY